MNLRDQQDFGTLLIQASAFLNLPPGLVEKDYWICQTLAALRARHYGQFVLKGGTSLALL